MVSIRSTILNAISHNLQDSMQAVSEKVLIEHCLAEGFDQSTAQEELAALEADGILNEKDGGYIRVEGMAEELDVLTYHGRESLPWQFSVTRTTGEIIVRQARGPPEKFDPVEKRYPIEPVEIGAEAIEFDQTVIRRVWSEKPAMPAIQSQRSEAKEVEFLYRDEAGWHFDQPEPSLGGSLDRFESTKIPGVTVAATHLRSEEGSNLQFTQEQIYKVTRELAEACEEVYILSAFELNEESVENEFWEVEDATAMLLEQK